MPKRRLSNIRNGWIRLPAVIGALVLAGVVSACGNSSSTGSASSSANSAAASSHGAASSTTTATAAGAAAPTVFAAASLSKVLPQIESGAKYTFGGSGALEVQIEQGAPADVFAAASPKQPAA